MHLNMMQVVTPEEQMKTLIANSYRDFHAPGVDYVCLHRHPHLTIKAYFFDEGSGRALGKNRQIVSPHDHRYDFATLVLRGKIGNAIWVETAETGMYGDGVTKFLEYSFRTPLNGGAGFKYERESWLRLSGTRVHQVGSRHTMCYDQIHTLIDVAPETVLLIWQYPDVKGPFASSRTFVDPYGASMLKHPTGAPSLEGLYNKFTEAQITQRLKQLESLQPRILQNYALHSLAGLDYIAD
jgi:hypothetical protein